MAATTRRHASTRVVVLAMTAVVLAAAGVSLIVFGLRGTKVAAHAQPLPAHPFALGTAAARALPAPGALGTPQSGSIQTSCEQHPGRPEVAIPALCIYAPLVSTAPDAEGMLPIPGDVRLVAQDLDSALLSARHGTTIIAGHVDDLHQGAGAFYFLYRTKPGTEVVVTGREGTRSRWRVFKVAAVRKDRLPADIFSRTGPRQLVLVTCGGELRYEPGYGNTYADNVLVYATPS